MKELLSFEPDLRLSLSFSLSSSLPPVGGTEETSLGAGAGRLLGRLSPPAAAGFSPHPVAS